MELYQDRSEVVNYVAFLDDIQKFLTEFTDAKLLSKETLDSDVWIILYSIYASLPQQ